MTTTHAESVDHDGRPQKKEGQSFESKLSEGRQRFLAHAIEQGLLRGRRTPEDFIRHFPPAAIMKGLSDQPQLRANILVIATGVRSKIALKKSAESCGLDLQIALDEGETDAETIVTLLDPDDRVRYLETRALWAYVTEGAFWQVDSKDKTRHAVAAEHIAYLVDRALKDRLITHHDVVEGITVGKLAEFLPRSELEKILTAALKAGNSNKPYADASLLSATPMSTIVQHVPLKWIWDQVIVPRIAQAHALASKEGSASVPPPAIKESVPPPKNKFEAGPLELEDSSEIMIDGGLDPSSGELDLDVDAVLGEIDGKGIAVPKPPLKA
jgi:hypothetical protein